MASATTAALQGTASLQMIRQQSATAASHANPILNLGSPGSLEGQRQRTNSPAKSAKPSSEYRRISPDTGSKPGTPCSSQQQQQQQQLPQQRAILDLRHYGPSEHWARGTNMHVRTCSSSQCLPQRPAWESSVAVVWGKPKAADSNPTGAASPRLRKAALDIAGMEHTDVSHWSSRVKGSSSNEATAAAAVPAAAVECVTTSHWAHGICKSMSPASRTVSNAGSNGNSPQQQQAEQEITAAAVTADVNLPEGLPGPQHTAAAGVKRQLPLGSLSAAVATAAASGAGASSWWVVDVPATTAAATDAKHSQAANENTNIEGSTHKRPKTGADNAQQPVVAMLDDDVTKEKDDKQQLEGGAAAGVAAADAEAAQQQQHDIQEDPWMRHDKEVQQLKQQQVALQELLQQAEQHVKAPLMREAQLLTMEMHEKVRARGLDSVSLAAISRDVPRIKRTADSDAEKVAAHMLAQEGGNWKASMERMMRMVKSSMQQKQLLSTRTQERPGSNTVSPVHSTAGASNAAAVAAAAVPEEPLAQQQQHNSSTAKAEPSTHWGMQRQASICDVRSYTPAAGAAAAQVSPYAGVVSSAHDSPHVTAAGQAAAASPYAAAAATTQHTGSPYTTGLPGQAGVSLHTASPCHAAVTAAKLQWPMVPASAVGSPVGSPVCSPMVPTSAVGSPLTCSIDPNGPPAPSTGIGSLILPTSVWGGPVAGGASGSSAGAAGAAGGVRYGSPMPTMHLTDQAAAGSPNGSPAVAPGARGRSRSPAGTCARPKLVRQQSRMAPKGPKASVAAMTGYQSSPQAANADTDAGMLEMPVDNASYAAAAAAAMQGLSVGYAAFTPAGGAADMSAANIVASNAFAAAAMVGMAAGAATCSVAAAPPTHIPTTVPHNGTEQNAASTQPMCADASFLTGQQDTTAAATCQSSGGTAPAAAADAVVGPCVPGPTDGGTTLEITCSLQAAAEDAIMADAGTSTASNTSHDQQSQQQMTTAAAAAAAFGNVTALTVDPDLEDAAGWLWGEGGLLPDTPGPANLLTAQQQQQQNDKHTSAVASSIQHGTALQASQMNLPSASALASGVAIAADVGIDGYGSSSAAVAQGCVEFDPAAAAALSVPPAAAAAVQQRQQPAYAQTEAAAAGASAAVGHGGTPASNEAPAPAAAALGTDQDDIALLQVLLGWASDNS